MRVMVIVNADEDTEAGVMPTERELAEMDKYNEEFFEADDFGEEFTPELREQEERLRQRTAGKRK